MKNLKNDHQKIIFLYKKIEKIENSIKRYRIALYIVYVAMVLIAVFN